MKASKMLNLLWAAVLLFYLPAFAQIETKVWTSNQDWASGAEFNVNHTDVPDQIQLTTRANRQIQTPYIWIANSSDNKVAMMRTSDGVIEKLIPVGANPSRTAVDVLNGVVWVGHRDASTVSKIDIATGTVTGTYTTGKAPRAIAIDNEGYIWVGNSLDNTAVKMKADGTIMATVPIGAYPYGATADGRGSVWFVCRSSNQIYRINQYSATVTAIVAVQNPYGIAVDLQGNIWTANYNPSSIQKIDGVTAQVVGTYPFSGGGRGVALDESGNVWAADSINNQLHKFSGTNGNKLNTWNVGSDPVGVAFDASGHIWVVNRGSNTAIKINAGTGTVVGTYGTQGNSPYTYSDMTGFSLQTFTLSLQGTWTGVHSACLNTPYSPVWKRILWNGSIPQGTEVKAMVRTSNNPNTFDRENWTGPYNSGDLLSVPRKNYIQIQLQMRTSDDKITPSVSDLTIEYQDCCVETKDTCDTGKLGICQTGEKYCLSEIPGDYGCRQTVSATTEACNGIDDDCDGVIDNNIPGVGASCHVPQQKGVCRDGAMICREGIMRCEGTIPASDEICDGLDNDCNGEIDENLFRECSTICETGTEYCENGQWVGCDARQPEPEICDGIDNNCNGQIDEMNEEGGECDTGLLGVCAKGYYGCVGGMDACIPAKSPSKELCDGLDNNCNGLIDEDNPEGGAACSTGLPGYCRLGVMNCVSGMLVCAQTRFPEEEVCDGIDNDCDGAIDNGALNACGFCGALPEEICDGIDNNCDGQVDEGDNLCPSGQKCLGGACVRSCPSGECPPDFECAEISGEKLCLDACYGVVCQIGEVCDPKTGVCRGICEGVKCEKGEQCVNGECKKGDCYTTGCSKGERCSNGNCIKDPCATVKCKADEYCWNGQCAPSCAFVACGLNEKCVGGKCVEDPCFDVTCGKNEQCNATVGICVEDPCAEVRCEAGKVCGNGECVDDPCLAITCPVGTICFQGDCASEANPEGKGGLPEDFEEIRGPELGGDDDDLEGDDDDSDDAGDDDDLEGDDDDNSGGGGIPGGDDYDDGFLDGDDKKEDGASTGGGGELTATDPGCNCRIRGF